PSSSPERGLRPGLECHARPTGSPRGAQVSIPIVPAEAAVQVSISRSRYLPGMRSPTPFWPRRLRWQLLAAWRWPALIVLSFVDGAIASALSPVSGHTKFIPAVIISLFANLFLVGAVAPWLARRIAARRGETLPAPKFPPVDSGEILVDRVATALVLLATLGVLVAGLGHEQPNLAPTKASAEAGNAMRSYVLAHGSAELKRNVDAANTRRVRPG